MAKKKQKQLKQYVAFVLDESGSMEFLKTEIVQAFNENVREIKNKSEEVPTRVSLVKFGSNAKIEFFNKGVEELDELDLGYYMPGGMTAMYDAIGMTIDEFVQLKDIDDENVSVLVIILSDGCENNSRIYGQRDIAERIQEMEGTGRWTFLYIGANQDLAQVSQSLNIDAGNMMSFTASPSGLMASSDATRCGINNYYAARTSTGITRTSSFFGNEGEIAVADEEGNG